MKAATIKSTKNTLSRVELFFQAFGIADVWFKHASWLLTLGGVKLAADLSHSWLLWLLQWILMWHFWSPIGCYLVGLPAEEDVTWRYAGKVLLRLAIMCVLGYYINGYVNELVDTIIQARCTK